MSLSRDELRAGLRGLGLESGSRVVVHSSVSNLGRIEGGAEAVVNALLDAVGPGGTVAAPTFTRYDEPYDPDESPSTTGAVTEALRQRDEAVRSPHPTKSIAAIGPDADALVADHTPANSLGPESPLHRLLERDGRVLLLGVDHTANSAIHVAERLANVPYRDQTAWTETTIDGSVESVEVNRVHCSRGFEVVRPLAEHAGIVARGEIGQANARLLDGRSLLSVVVELLEADPGALLCSVPGCDRCQYARERIADAV
ncbi:AAC(3) family N-acetyltransferase [Halalkalicoccus subterraneus]|uniref:AAC(3) family N-acetyltransferase n=1 Tax=Halalkalicoccus subterraneus TaxID=2675002 RepID=UPI0013CEA6C7|nr:AAC(3) family N-acetyltransferase [Halalkalicoccus subterraneus]